MNLLVVGGAGFIGSNFIFYMLKKHEDYHITCLDSLTYAGNFHTLENVMTNSNFSFVKGNITDINAVENCFSSGKFDVVVNFAAESHVDNSIKNPMAFVKTNILGTQILLEASKKFNVARFHQVSTDEVYGDLPIERTDLLFSEASPIKASSPYSASKAAADLLVLAYFRTFKLPVTITRCSNNYGPYQFPEKLIPLMISKASKDLKLPIYGKGLNVRDWIYVEDHCTAIDIVLQKGVIGEVYNVGSNNERCNIELVKNILKRLNKPTELIEFVSDRQGHDLRYAIDSSKVKGLGWDTKTAFDKGLQLTVEWYLNNILWLKNIESGEYNNAYSNYLAEHKK